jgi:probable F420-dependent oxidoreductase
MEGAVSVGISMTQFPPFQDGPSDPWLLARETERLGFESMWAGEHHVIPQETGSSNAYYSAGVPAMHASLVRLAGVAAVTTTVTIGTSILLLPQRNPLLLAKELATLDVDSGGRLEVGIGLGWNRDECEIMGGNFARRAAQTRESVEVMRALWTEEFVEYHGEFYDFPPVKSSPGPLTKPHPPILLGMHTEQALWLEAVSQPDLIHREGIEHIEWGRGRLDELCRDAGRDPASVAITVMVNNSRGEVDAALVKRYLDVGADRIILLGSLGGGESFGSAAEAVDWLTRLAESVLA